MSNFVFVSDRPLTRQILETVEKAGGEFKGIKKLAWEVGTTPNYLKRLIRESGCMEIDYIIENSNIIGVVKKNE